MAKTLAIITANGNSITAHAWAPGQAHKAFKALVTEHNGTVTEIETPFGKRLQGTFNDEKTAKKVTTALNKRYASANWTPELDCDRKPPQARGDAPTEKKMTLKEFIISKPDCSKREAREYGFKGTSDDLYALKVEYKVRQPKSC